MESGLSFLIYLGVLGCPDLGREALGFVGFSREQIAAAIAA